MTASTPRWNPDRRRWLGALATLATAGLAGCAAGGSRRTTAGPRPPVALTDPSVGPHAVEVRDEDWLDATRDRSIPVRLFLPTGMARAPLVVFSHGLGGSRNGYSHFGRYWASHGIATVHPQHAGSDRAVWSAGGGLALLGSLRSAATPENAIARALDVRHALDRLLDTREWSGRFDAARVGVAGHSFGANTALLAAGARYREDDGRTRTFGDPRVRAAVVMSAPSLPSDQDPHFVYSSIGVPTMHLTGTLDATPIPGLSTMPEERRVPFDSMAAGPRYLGIFEGGRHSMFNDWARDPASESIKMEARALTLAFWRSVFESDTGAARLLREPARVRPTAGELLATWEARG